MRLDMHKDNKLPVKKLLIKIAPYCLIAAVLLYAFWGITHIFFQQDEWLALGKVMSYWGHGGFWADFGDHLVISKNSTRILPLSVSAIYFFFSWFKTSGFDHGLLALALGFVNSSLIYWLIKKITNSKLVGLASALFWLTNNYSYQALAWIGTMIPSEFCFLFFLSALVFFVNYLESSNRKHLLFAVLSVIASLSFKESSVFYPITFIGLYLLYPREKAKEQSKRKLIALLLVPLLLVLVLPRLFLVKESSDIIPGGYSPNLSNTIYNAFELPVRTLFQVYIPQTQYYQFVYSVNRTHYNGPTESIETSIADSFSALAAFYTLLALLVVVLMANKQHKKLLIFLLVSLFASTMPYIILQNLYAVLEPRYFIFPAFFGGVLISLVAWSLLERLGRLRPVLFLILFIPLILYYSSGVKTLLASDIYVGSYRHGILNTVSAVKPHLSKNNIFYFFTDNNGFYEFQSGFGQTLAVWLYDSGKIPREALTDMDFWDPSYEGFKRFPDGGYGYFMTYSKLRSALKDNSDIKIENVHAFYWDLQKHTVRDASPEIQDKLSKDLVSIDVKQKTEIIKK